MKNVAFIDCEVGVDDKKIHDLGAVRTGGAVLHTADVHQLEPFLAESDFLCGHNIVHHDLVYLKPYLTRGADLPVIDTLYLAPLLFPRRPYHALLKGEKLRTDELNNPVNDCRKAEKLFMDEVGAFEDLSPSMKSIFQMLLGEQPEFAGFFHYMEAAPSFLEPSYLIRLEFRDKICQNAPIADLLLTRRVELAYALALIQSGCPHSVLPGWLMHQFPYVENVIRLLCGTPCPQLCPYCRDKLDIHKGLKEFFGFDAFRTYNGEPLQEKAAQAAVDGKSLLAVFPTGGGKSITFQLPALMAGRNCRGLTVVISPLQSLMKDQVDHLNAIGITEAVTINGLLSPVERADAYQRVEDGSAYLLYISPEMLRSKTIERILLARTISRFVIDEAHCFSAWGQDFRVDYLYIGEFIRQLQEKKGGDCTIPVSCFTATAKQKVISDIRQYFKKTLDADLELFASTAVRENLHYTVLFKENDDEKYNALRHLIGRKKCPTIVYVSRTRRTRQLAEKLSSDGFPALPFNGKMEAADKVANQDAFLKGDVNIIVATSAFGMGVDKKDVQLVVHYDISDSLENYVQEAGRAGRDPALNADCYVLYNSQDLDNHFVLLNQTKLSLHEIQQVWQAVKQLSRQKESLCCSALEIARQAGWKDDKHDIETRVTTAIAALENAGYLKRGQNVPHIYATSVQVQNMGQASQCIDGSPLFSDSQRQDAKRIMQSLISSKYVARAGNDDAESRVDYLADILGIEKREVLTLVDLLREADLLSRDEDMSALLCKGDTHNRSSLALGRFEKLERYLLNRIPAEGCQIHLKEWVEQAKIEGIPQASTKDIRTILYFLTIKKYITKQEHPASSYVLVTPSLFREKMLEKFERRIDICRYMIDELYQNGTDDNGQLHLDKPICFSLVGSYRKYKNLLTPGSASQLCLQDFKDALLYLSKIGAMKLEGGFLVSYNAMELHRLVMDNKIRYKVEDYKTLHDFYQQKMQQIHIVGEYANMMVRDYDAALQFVQDYFQMDYQKFLRTYFQGDRAQEIKRNITPEKYDKLFGALSEAQARIIHDDESQHIAVVAGPGSGKTRVLVHKLASLLLMEDVKHEQLLMLTFSRAAATEFKKRLADLIGTAVGFVDVKTFHSYCFDLLDRIGSLEGVDNIVQQAAEKIASGDVEPGKIAKSVLVIDEAQDMDASEFALVEALMHANEDMRVIAVGDDDQNIYQFRGSDSRYLRSLVTQYDAVLYELNDNYRSCPGVVTLANHWIEPAKNRMKNNPIRAVRTDKGTVQLTYHPGGHLAQPVVQQLMDTRGKGSCCVLTATNAEALQVLGLLTQNHVPAQLIQSTGDFCLLDLAEVRYFIKLACQDASNPTISHVQWENAKDQLTAHYKNSTCLPNCLNLLTDFCAAFPLTRYKSDLVEFIRESKFEDFYARDDKVVFVSTIHKAKGREFDQVYLLLDGFNAVPDEERRKLYVGITRAKNALYIHYNTPIFRQDLGLPGVKMLRDPAFYPPPQEIALHLTHRDVVLSFFQDKKRLILSLQSGHPLRYAGGKLYAQLGDREYCVALLSHAQREKMHLLAQQGYRPYRAVIRFIVAWKPADADETAGESAVLLPDLYLKKS